MGHVFPNIPPENYFPIFSLDDALIYMVHYKTPNEALEKWNERKTRVNWYNLLIITDTSDKNYLQEFDALPYGKKVCFVPFKSDFDSAFYVDYKLDTVVKSFGDTLNRLCSGLVTYYDLFDMLLYGKKTPLIDMK
ncbi:MAG: DUF1919 domain-containing protein [Selenomonadaceae bacterium]|nr:DUF1919 domain-containing protein [Selenomonadaceae bacterium]